MGKVDKVLLTPLKKISNPKGDIFHGLKKSDVGFNGFGEAYFTTIAKNEIKGWKKHTKMTLNLIVPAGEIEFVLYDETIKEFKSIVSSPENYQRLTVPPNFWMAFRGIGNGLNMALNSADIEHDPDEAENCKLEKIPYEW